MNDPTPHPDTLLVTAGRPDGPETPLNHPVVPASSFRTGGDLWYGRSDGTPTIHAFEELVGGLEGGHAVAYGSGMAAVSAVLSLLSDGATIARSQDIYHGVGRLMEDGASRGRWVVQEIEAHDTASWIRAVDEVDLVWIESPTNPLLAITDLPAVCGERRRSAIVAVDSTFATPLGQQPLQLGADLVVHSATKFIGGHSDLMAGVAIAADQEQADRLRLHRTLHGAVPGALEAFLALRGARTLAVRLDRAMTNAAELARRLSEHGAVVVVRYPGLATDPGHAAASSFMKGGGAVLSFQVADDAAADSFLAGLRTIVHATSLGGVESTAERRSGYPGSAHIPPGLIRLSVGCEHIEDLWADIDRALSASD